MCGASIPRKLSRILARYGDNPDALREAGTAYAIDQISDLIAGGVDGGQNAIQSSQILLGEDGLVIIEEVAVVGGHGVAVQRALIGGRADGAGRVGGNDRLGVASHLVQSVRLDQIDQLIVREQEHVRRCGGIFQITGLPVNRANSAVLKGVFLLGMCGGKFVAELFGQLQFALIRPDLQSDLFLFRRGFGRIGGFGGGGGIGLPLGFFGGGIGFGGRVGACR